MKSAWHRDNETTEFFWSQRVYRLLQVKSHSYVINIMWHLCDMWHLCKNSRCYWGSFKFAYRYSNFKILENCVTSDIFFSNLTSATNKGKKKLKLKFNTNVHNQLFLINVCDDELWYFALVKNNYIIKSINIFRHNNNHMIILV